MSVAIVGLACTYPDAPDPRALWETVLWRRRAFRRVPAERLDLADYHSPDRSAPDRTHSTRAALIEGWEFDRNAFHIPGQVHRVTDPAHWLALDTASRALADAGFPGGEGLDRDRVSVVVGNTLTGEVSRACALRLRWPYVRRVLASVLTGFSEEETARLLARAEAEYLRPFPETSADSLAGGLPGAIAGRICDHFGLRGGGYAVDGACASSLLAVIIACRSLLDASADFALAGGVDLGLDPFELVGLAKTGALAGERMRIYDTRSDGFWPGEGCGIVALMRTADARAAGLRIYAEITGWGVSSGGIARPGAGGSQFLALRRAYDRAGVSPAGVALFEGSGTGSAAGDTVELTALTRLLSDAVRQAAIGAVSANIGHTKAAAGVAGLIKATLSIASGVLPPTTGCGSPHRLLTAPGTPLRVLSAPEPWPAGPRHAGVSAMGFGGVDAHVVLTLPVGADVRLTVPKTAPAPRAADRPSPEEPLVFAFSGENAQAVRPVLERVADQAERWSEAELCDLACALGTAPAGPLRIPIVAGSAEELAERAGLALERLDTVKPAPGTRDPEGTMKAARPDAQPAPGTRGPEDAAEPARPDAQPQPDTRDPGSGRPDVLETAVLWASGAIPDLSVLYGDQPARPVDIWRDRVFISNPCSSAPGGSPYGDAGHDRHTGVVERLTRDTGDAAWLEPPDTTGPVPGVARWVRCFAEDRETGGPDSSATAWGREGDRGARPRADREGKPARRIVIDDPLRPETTERLVAAAREAVTGHEALTVVCESDAVTGFLRTLAAEHPDLDFGAEPPRERTVLALDGQGPLPVGPADVVLVSGGGKGAGFDCALALAEAGGCALALLGRASPDHDAALAANLGRLTGAGVRYGYAAAEVSDAGEVARAVRDLERALGPVTMVVHAAGVDRPGRFTDLTAQDFERHVASKLTGLDNLLDVTMPHRVVTFGSVAGRHGLIGESPRALADGLMRERVRRLGGLNIDWPVWSAAGTEEADATGATAGADVTSIAPWEGTELFLKLLRTKDLPPSVAVHGRLDEPPAPCPAGGRFLDGIRVHVPGVELVADSRLSLKSDGYLDDHRIDGLAVLPAVVALEAMAQAAGVLAGRPLDEAVQMTFDRPVVVPDEGGTTIRVCALRHEQTVEVVVRSEETGFRVDHFRAVFPVDPADETLAVPQLNRDGAQPLNAGDLYGALCFHTGRFQRVRELTLVEARGCRGELHGDDPDGWFEDRPVLGSPGLSDATIHALQACVPHRRLLPVGGERLVVRPSQGDVRLHATERNHHGGEYVWDVTATDVRGRLVAAWTGLRLKDVGPLPRHDPWPPNLLAVYLQRAAVGLGLDPALHVTMDGGTSHSHLGDLVLGVDDPARCAWEPVGGGAARASGAASALLAAELLPHLDETEETVATRVRTVVECLSKAGRPPETPLAVVGSHEGGWLLLRADTALIASTVVQVRGVRTPVAVAIMTEEQP
ncbi:SDR family NAD(P)-dependent oxidoreductase [Streptosporangium sp. NPDC000396]|uniref:SDR family NAD(P)-dependent oxidoreductase n=1 Tax=Streptosporangium sp. NPDC000396 TaxID=3366185 RepID=UPI00368B271B